MQISELHCKDVESESQTRAPRTGLVIIFYLFISCWLCWVFAVAGALPSKQGLLSSCPAWASRWGRVSSCGPQALGAQARRLWRVGSVAVTPRLSGAGWVVVVGHSCSAVCGSFQDQEFNPCLLRWHIDWVVVGHSCSAACGSFRDEEFNPCLLH